MLLGFFPSWYSQLLKYIKNNLAEDIGTHAQKHSLHGVKQIEFLLAKNKQITSLQNNLYHHLQLSSFMIALLWLMESFINIDSWLTNAAKLCVLITVFR